MKSSIVIVLLGLLLFSCNSYSDQEKSEFDDKIQAYLKHEGVECEKSPSGLYYKIIEEGEGRYVQLKDQVTFKYTGKFTDGKIFDEHQEDSVVFQLDQTINAWKEVMVGLKKGGKAFIVAPPQLGYGTHDLNDIPPNSILVYDIEVIDIR